jgi:HK97 family phage portal protein
MVDLQRFQIEEVARIFSLPPVFLQDLTHGTFSNTEQQDLHLVKHTVRRWITQIEQEMNLKLFGRDNNDLYVEFNLDGLLRGDFSSRMAGYATGIQNGILKPNEARASENRPSADNGDDLLIQGATVPLGSQVTQENNDV